MCLHYPAELLFLSCCNLLWLTMILRTQSYVLKTSGLSFYSSQKKKKNKKAFPFAPSTGRAFVLGEFFTCMCEIEQSLVRANRALEFEKPQ